MKINEKPARILTPTIIPEAVGERLDNSNIEVVGLLLEFAKESYHDYDALSTERINLLGAVTLAYRSSRWLSVIDYALVLDEFLDTQGYWEDDKRNLELGLKASEGLRPGYEDRIALLLHNLAVIHMAQGDYERAEADFEHSLALQRQRGDKLAVSRVMHYLGRLRAVAKDYKLARQFFGESLTLGEEVGDKRGVSATLHEMGTLCLDEGTVALAADFYQRSLVLSREVGNLRDIADTLHQLGILHYRQGEFDRAQNYFEEALQLRRKVAHQEGVAKSLAALGHLAHDRGNLDQAKRLWKESLALFEYLGAKESEAIRNQLSTLQDQ